VNAILAEKATPEEAQAFREWLVEAAQRAAEAAKEGGFMGFGAEQVSEREREMLERVRRALSA
jgi:ABC-type Fe3+ transport system substrate-binding protein